jgi:2-(1,2-epoxy-1,2-dihydrophenyl)acetyl-CoA isomerase
MATSVVPVDGFDAAVAGLAERLAAGPTLAYGAMKRALSSSATAELPEALAFEGRMMNLTGATEDHRRAVEAFVAKERPVFNGT